MKMLALTAGLALMLTGCSIFQKDYASQAAAIDEPARPVLSKAVQTPEPEPAPAIRRASMGPRGIMPCNEGESLISPCHRASFHHLDAEPAAIPLRRISMPAPQGEE